ncbi:glycosyltransferase family 4 protein [Halalkalibacter alkaliphilus]|uniref:Glycosyltransferase family 4 protein n=1 Tax=Halalkalibacter alkaliphilus TaxID=2917993 RepID=A0A9X2CSR1_9BACI|nr:glycosyltransferase family 4 protein [Halalkalibacter alkaliphilus]MCL7747425.1 glycosyltransferase family 4 protein [Halalkalibacter alkaliphilus]
MKILMICTEKLPVPAVKGGAIQTYIDGVSSSLSKKHELTILGSSDPSLPMDEKVNNVRYVRTPGGLLEDYRDGVRQFLQSEPDSFDLIHIFNRPRLVLAVRECAPNARIVLSMHNDMFKREKIEPEEAAAAIEQLDKIITISNYIGTAITDLFPQAAPKIQTIYSGVDINRFAPPHSKDARDMRQEIRKEHNLEGKKVILFAGRLSKNKGADVLVQAMPEVIKKHPDAALVIVGSKWFSVNEVSDYVAYVRALASRLPIPVVNTGFVAPSEIQKWFAAADVFVCPSQWQEPLARVHYEAMASGLPVITTKRGGNPEVITPNENGFVVEQPEDPKAFAELIIPLLSDPKLSKKLGLNGRKLVEEKFTWDRVISDISGVWDDIKNKIENNIPVTPEEQSKSESNADPVEQHVAESEEEVAIVNTSTLEDSSTVEHLQVINEENVFENEEAVEEVSTLENLEDSEEEFGSEATYEESTTTEIASDNNSFEDEIEDYATDKQSSFLDNLEEEIDLTNNDEETTVQDVLDLVNNMSKEQYSDDKTFNNMLDIKAVSEKLNKRRKRTRKRTHRLKPKSKLVTKRNAAQLTAFNNHEQQRSKKSANKDRFSQVYNLLHNHSLPQPKENSNELFDQINALTTAKLLSKLHKRRNSSS